MTFCNFKSREWENISVLKATKQDICRINWIKKNKTYQYKYVKKTEKKETKEKK
jgi:hypothetical protein